MVLTRAGVRIVKASLMLISKDFRLGMGDDKLFVEVEKTAEVQARMKEFLPLWGDVDALTRRAIRPQPTLMFDCRRCEFWATDCLGQGVEDHVFELPRLNQARFERLLDLDMTSISDITADFDLTPRQERIRKCVQTGEEYVGRSLRQDLDAVIWPAHYLDFETVMTAIPLYPDIAPYSQLPTQYSIHVCAALGQVEGHREYLATDPTIDCREELAERLIGDLGRKGSVISYSPFEKTVIKKLAAAFPKLEKPLTAIVDRIVDLAAIIRNHYYHPGFHGSLSIKQVLPVLVPTMSYDGLDIGEGDTASAMMARMAKGQIVGEAAKRIRRELLAYCEQDTLAMVRLHERMGECGGGGETR